MFNNWMDMTFSVKNFIRENPGLFYPLCSCRFSQEVRKNYFVLSDTQIVIEGFPRSANSFAVTAFLQSQPYPVKIGHHIHAPAQIIRAVKWQIPTLVLLRNPKDAVLSCAAGFPSNSIYKLLSYYLSFYSSIFEYRNSYVIGEFQEVTQSFCRIIERINRKFDTQFAVWENTPANQQKVLDSMGGQINTSFPHKKLNIKNSQEEEMRRKILDAISSKKYAGMLEKANQIYQIFKQAAHDEREIVGAGS